MGLMPGFQNAEIKSSKFKQTASYVTDGEFQREGMLYVDNGRMSLEMVTDTTKVNELLKSLYTKSDPQASFKDSEQGTTRNFSYDFNSLLGYYILYDKNAAGYGGFIPLIEAAQADP